MVDREKVIKALECYERTAGERCKNCPYNDSDMCVEEMAKDALALIDTQYKLILELQNLISIGTKMMNGGEVNDYDH